MASIPATTPEEYLEQLPEDRRAVVATLRRTVKRHLPKGYVEGAGWGMLTYSVPLAQSGPTYNGQPLCYVAIAAQKNHYSLYLTGAYMDAGLTRQVQDAFTRAGKKLDMGKSCVRFKSLDALPLDDLGAVIAAVPVDEFVKRYQAIHAGTKTGARKAAAQATARKKAATGAARRATRKR
ncbi:MAG TPA: DUF1801 domain-containing protein [Gemmatimonadales bacterium]|nr:DUF1801 domain-containing protein [Gemmatimonadales bacterium]